MNLIMFRTDASAVVIIQKKTSVVVKKCKVCINVNFKKYAYYNKLDVSYFPLLYIFIAENKIEI